MKSFFIITSVFFTLKVYSQEVTPVPITIIPLKNVKAPVNDTIVVGDNGVKQADITDLLGKFFHSKTVSRSDSITSKPVFSIIPAVGYTLVSKIAVGLSGNIIFRTGPKSRVSTIIGNTSYTQRKQFTLPIQTSIWTKDNTFNFVGNYRYLKYPQSTFGLGSGSNISNEDPMDYNYFGFYETALRHITGNIYAGLGYILDNHWNISDKGNLNGTIADYAVYGKTNHAIASGITFNALLDSRDNAINPSKGGYGAIQYRDNYGFLGSTLSWRSIIIDIRQYYKFPEGSDNVIALWSYNWLILSGKPVYLDLPSTQWDPNSATGRGYIQGRFRGAQMLYLEGEYRYRITDDGLLGGVLFFNGQSFSGAPGTKLQAVQPGFGPGARVKLNKLSNTNITIDYGFGREGSKGLFIDVGEAF